MTGVRDKLFELAKSGLLAWVITEREGQQRLHTGTIRYVGTDFAVCLRDGRSAKLQFPEVIDLGMVGVQPPAGDMPAHEQASSEGGEP